jgi:hypothetical protein
MIKEWPCLHPAEVQNKANDYRTTLFDIWRKKRIQVILEI